MQIQELNPEKIYAIIVERGDLVKGGVNQIVTRFREQGIEVIVLAEASLVRREDGSDLSCPFCGAVPVFDWTTLQPDGEFGAMHINHSEKCYIALITGARTHAGGNVAAWCQRL